MPGKHKPEKKFISLSLMRELIYKVEKRANELHFDRTAYITNLLMSDTVRVQLTDGEKSRLNAEITDERKKRVANWSGYTERRAKIDATLARKAK